jgi:adenylylsulfate reductase subunit A
MKSIEKEIIETDVLIIGGGTAGCLAAIEIKEIDQKVDVTIIEKAHIDRSGCLALGMNAINAYLNNNETPESFTEFVKWDSMGLIREDLVKSQAELFEYAVKKVESFGLPIMKDERGKYIPRGRWNIRINGESIKPIIASVVKRLKVNIMNYTFATNFIMDKGRVCGVFGFNIRENKFYIVRSKSVIVATGGASGIYRPNNPYDAEHKTWYSPFNTGDGYAMGIRAGAEMTTFEMRYIALRTKDVISPTGTIALGFKAPYVNIKGEEFMEKRWAHIGGNRAPTPIRAYAPIVEIKEGRGPIYLDTTHLNEKEVRELKEAYLDTYPDQVLYWISNNLDPGKHPVEIQLTEPYIVGGHCQSGYWVEVNRKTTLEGLFAAGDVAGGAPYKFISGCFAEGIIAGRTVLNYIKDVEHIELDKNEVDREIERVYFPLFNKIKLSHRVGPYDFEVRLQKIMDEYAGGISSFYELNENRLLLARKYLNDLIPQFKYLYASDLHSLKLAHEAINRVYVARVLVEHLIFRKETRWPGYQTRIDYPDRDDKNWLKFVNSKMNITDKNIDVFTREV